MRVFVVGAGGFIGGALARYLHANGFCVGGSSHDLMRLKPLNDLLERAVEIRFGQRVESQCFEGFDAVVYCAYKPGASNSEEIPRIFEAAHSVGIQYHLFISSHSSRPDAISQYGIQKHKLECFFLEKGQSVVRPGLVVGAGGLFARNQQAILSAPFLVLPSIDQALVYYIALENLLESITSILEKRLLGAFNLFHETPVSLRAFVEAVRRKKKHKIPLISIQLVAILKAVKLLRWMKIPLSSALERLGLMQQNIEAPIHTSDLHRFVRKQISIADALDVRGK